LQRCDYALCSARIAAGALIAAPHTALQLIVWVLSRTVRIKNPFAYRFEFVEGDAAAFFFKYSLLKNLTIYISLANGFFVRIPKS